MSKLLIIAIVMGFISCSPGPRRQLNQSERVADMFWLYSKFDQNYAPRNLKEKNFSFKYSELKQQYMKQAMLDQSNETFYQLMMSFIAEFKDAHTSGDIPISSLPGRTKISYLGFKGKRVKDAYLISELLPTIKKGSHYPLKVGDSIEKIDGVELITYIDTHLTKNRNLGHKQANYTALMGKIFTRRSYFNAFSKNQDATLTIKRGEETLDITLPWVTKDFVTFRQEQTKAQEEKKKAQVGASYNLSISDEDYKQLETLTQFVALKSISLENVKSIIAKTKNFKEINSIAFDQFQVQNLAQTFQKQADLDVWTFIELMKAYLEPIAHDPKDIIQVMKKDRFIPAIAHHVPHTSHYKAYTTYKSVKGIKTKIGVIRLHSFSPGGDEADIIKEFKKTLKYFIDFDVQNVVIDMLNNGGGSLTLGTKLAQAMTSKKLELPTIKLKINETWLDNFETKSLSAKSDAEKEIARRTFETLMAKRAKNEILSQELLITSLFPLQMTPNKELIVEKKAYPFNFVLLVNEMCASMCDIFSAMIQDNKLGSIVGSQTMGAGGNVTQHIQAPNSNLIIRQTESLLVRSRDQKDYIENNGIIPDVKIKTYEMQGNKFEKVIEKAFEQFVKPEVKEEKKKEKKIS